VIPASLFGFWAGVVAFFFMGRKVVVVPFLLTHISRRVFFLLVDSIRLL
jgi:hypothetical protein